MTPKAALAFVRKTCLAFEGATEKPSHGAPTFFAKNKKTFVMFHDDHHGDGRLAIWCVAPPGAQGALVEAMPAHFFVPAYVGHRGWIGMRLDGDAPREEIASIIEDAHRTVMQKKPK